MEKSQRIQVVVRKRPISKKEYDKGDIDIIQTPNQNSLILQEAKYTRHIESN
jgi:hypothetical protein